MVVRIKDRNVTLVIGPPLNFFIIQIHRTDSMFHCRFQEGTEILEMNNEKRLDRCYVLLSRFCLFVGPLGSTPRDEDVSVRPGTLSVLIIGDS